MGKIIKKIFNTFKYIIAKIGNVADYRIFLIIVPAIIMFGLLILTFTDNVTTSSNIVNAEESEAGYIVNKTTENSFHYIISDDNATPEFIDNYYYTVFVDDNYIKFQIPYKVFESYNLGDHLTVFRKYNSVKKTYYDYEVVIYDINVPAVIVNEDYE
jgi:hypothetical protein